MSHFVSKRLAGRNKAPPVITITMKKGDMNMSEGKEVRISHFQHDVLGEMIGIRSNGCNTLLMKDVLRVLELSSPEMRDKLFEVIGGLANDEDTENEIFVDPTLKMAVVGPKVVKELVRHCPDRDKKALFEEWYKKEILPALDAVNSETVPQKYDNYELGTLPGTEGEEDGVEVKVYPRFYFAKMPGDMKRRFREKDCVKLLKYGEELLASMNEALAKVRKPKRQDSHIPGMVPKAPEEMQKLLQLRINRHGCITTSEYENAIYAAMDKARRLCETAKKELESLRRESEGK